MIEVHSLPTADVYSAVYYTYVEATVSTKRVRSTGANLSSVVLIERSGLLESGLTGVKRYLQVSTSILATKPKEGDAITIDGVNYKIMSPRTRKNPAFVTFYEADLKTI